MAGLTWKIGMSFCVSLRFDKSRSPLFFHLSRACVFLLQNPNSYVVEDLDAVQVEVSPVDVKSNSEDVEVTYGPKRTQRLTMPLTFFGVFDGHGGDKASQFCADWMSAYIRNDESYPYDLGYTMKNSFIKFV